VVLFFLVALEKLNYVEEGLKIKTNLFDRFKHLMEQLQEHNYLTYQHSIRVGSMLSELGFRLGFSIEKTEMMYLIGILHDIGKIRVPKSVLNKSGKLSIKEWEKLQCHVKYGVELLEHLPISKEVVEAIAAHHENVDGSGYPLGLTASDIPYYAKMIRVVDSYDAMTDNRPYRKGLTCEKALEELQKGIGVYYDQYIVICFCELVKGRVMLQVK
jgi:putative nucleotidyltransferase with HDIG domain